VITGDIHSNWANELIADFDQLDSKSVGTEFVGTSITSGGDGAASPKAYEHLLAENPFLKFFNGERGYVHCEITPKAWRSDYRTVPYVVKPGAPLVTRASFVVESGRPVSNRVRGPRRSTIEAGRRLRPGRRRARSAHSLTPPCSLSLLFWLYPRLASLRPNGRGSCRRPRFRPG